MTVAVVDRASADVATRMRAAAGDALAFIIEARARRYWSDPRLFDRHFPMMRDGASRLAPEALIARVDALIEQEERGQIPRWFGLGGENIAISLRAARLVGEWLLAERAALQAAE